MASSGSSVLCAAVVTLWFLSTTPTNALSSVDTMLPRLRKKRLQQAAVALIDAHGNLHKKHAHHSATSKDAETKLVAWKKANRRQKETQRKKAKLNPATCMEVVLVEPRRIRALTRAAESAVRQGEMDLLTLAHGASNAGYVQERVAASHLLTQAKNDHRLRYLNLHVGDLGGDSLVEVGSKKGVAAHEHQAREVTGTYMQDTASYHDQYSRVLKSPEFWKQLACDRVVVMQSDTLFCPGSKVHLHDFAAYGYVGGRTPNMDTASRIHMNGGFSLRSRPGALACLALPSAQNPHEPEDSFFSHCPLLQQPPISDAERFSVDNGLTFSGEIPLGVHKPWVGPFSSHTENLCKGAYELSREQVVDP